tara:strand:- start:89 stop:217 length:129 start_codon:yes stop_codon:yes gene_type:complete
MGTEVPELRSSFDEAASLFSEEQLGLLEALFFLLGCLDQMEK